MKYSRLTREERYQIEILLKRGDGIRAIARALKRSAGTISEEVKKDRLGYSAERREVAAKAARCKPRVNQRVIHGKLKDNICSKLTEFKWSPEQIVESLQLQHGTKKVCFQTIYRFIDRDYKQGGRLKYNLRILRKKRKDRKMPLYKRPKDLLPPRMSIRERPAIVEKRQRLGDYERDTMLGKRNGPLLLTIVDRTTRRLRIACVKKLNAENIHRATCRLLRDEPLQTITNDNGIEFHFHQRTATALDTKIYFSRAYRAWERGTNENTNGLLRQFFPKKKSIPFLTRSEERRIEDLLNNRPRKCLGFQTPNQLYKKLKRQGVRLDL